MARIRKYAKNSDVMLTKHFHLKEIQCKCTRSDCKEVIVDLDHMDRLEAFRVKIGRPVVITSGHRCPAHNAAEGGVSNSTHPQGNATDIQVPGLSPDKVADEAEPYFNGLGRYNTFTHTDSRDLGAKGKKARWDFRTKK